MLLESLLGSIIGIGARLLPEVINFFDRKDERKHELSMMDKQLDYEKVKSEFKLEQKYTEFSIAQLDAMSEAYKQQATAESRASKWVASASAFVRPGITYIIFGMYVLFKLSIMITGIYTGQPLLVVFGTWTPDDMALLNATISFWFLNRTIEKYKK